MRTFLQRMLWLIAALSPAIAQAQAYTDLYSFSPPSGFPASNTDGAIPYCALVLSSNVLYGTTYEGGTNGEGAVFPVHTDGTHFTNLHSFSALTSGFFGNNNDGAQPFDTLLLSSNMLFGTAYGGGASAFGTVFRINTDGSGFTNLHSFANNGGVPRAGLIISSNVLYGTAGTGGTLGFGSVFKINPDGTGFTNIFNFNAASNGAFAPEGGLVVSGDTLFGTTSGGGSLGGGVVFAVSTSGKNYTNLFNFKASGGENQSTTNDTGGAPASSLLLVGNTLYGTTQKGGTNGNGVVFALNTDGSGFTNMHTFSATDNSTGTNRDGAGPLCQLLLMGGNLYGTAGGGRFGFGTVFAMNTNGGGFTNIYDFQTIFNSSFVNFGGDSPAAGLIFSGNTFYGTTLSGGQAVGNVYALELALATPIPLTFQSTNGKLVLSWNSSAFSLQSSPSLTGSFTNVPNAISPYTNTSIAAQQFFRLQAN